MTSRHSSALLCLMVLALAGLSWCAPDLPAQEGQVVPTTGSTDDDVNATANSRLLLDQDVMMPGDILLAEGPLGSLIKRTTVVHPMSPASFRTRVLLASDDYGDDDDEPPRKKNRRKKSKMVGVHIKELRVPASMKGYGGGGKKKNLMKDKRGKLLMVETPVSKRFATYLKMERGFLNRIAYLGTTKRKELNKICRKVARGSTKFLTDLNIDVAPGIPDTGDDLTDSKVDHQFGCTITRGADVMLNPKLKKGVVFALIEFGKSNNLIDCQKGQKKCNIWELMDDDDVENLVDTYGRKRSLLATRRQLLGLDPISPETVGVSNADNVDGVHYLIAATSASGANLVHEDDDDEPPKANVTAQAAAVTTCHAEFLSVYPGGSVDEESVFYKACMKVMLHEELDAGVKTTTLANLITFFRNEARIKVLQKALESMGLKING